MRFWDSSDAEIAIADAKPWAGPLSSAMRPLSLYAVPRLTLVATVLSIQAPLTVMVLTAGATDEMAHPATAWTIASLVLVVGLAMPALVAVLPPRTIRHALPLAVVSIIFFMGVVSSVGMWAAGPRLGVMAVLYLQALPFAFYTLHLRWALLMAANAVGGCAIVLAFQGGWPAPTQVWLLVAATVVATSWVLGIIAERADRLAASEHEARVELAEVNQTLEGRVSAQVTEIERLGQLRRFLSPQIADVVLSGDSDAVTRPHRQRIAVFFCDLRGFTAFTRDSEPEEVIAITDEYYRVVGTLLQRHGATIGGYAGDGIMAYLGDPVPHPEPAKGAVRMVAELREVMATLVAEWARRGHDLSYGIGLAYGYATLGVVGFDGRYDYTPMGGVVNLAARLCGKATASQILLDHATYAEVDGSFTCQPVDGLELKGLGAQRAYALG
jgi:class 3 adenylate cyclase